MLQMVMKSGDGEDVILDLVDTPDFVLIKMCDLMIRKQDLRHPDVQRGLKDISDAFKAKMADESKISPPYTREDIEFHSLQLDELLAELEVHQ